MARDISVPTEWVPVRIDSNRHARTRPAGNERTEDIELENRTSDVNQAFYQHARHYSSFTQTLLRDLPSRGGNAARTLRRRRGSAEVDGAATLRSYQGTVRGAIDAARFGDDVDAVVDQVQGGVEEMQDEHMAREVELNTLRELERPLAYKRQVKQRLEQREFRRSREVGLMTRLSSSVHYALVKCRRRLVMSVEFLKLWKGHMKVIRGQLGSGVATYFLFLESLFYLNLFSLLFIAGFVVTPQLLLRVYDPVEAFASYGANLSESATPYEGNGQLAARDLFTGQGWLDATELFYGFYYAGNMTVFSGLTYRMPYAYFFTVTLCLAAQLLVLAIVTARLYRARFIESASVVRNTYFNRVLCSWDFTIVSDKMAALRHQTIANELRELTCDAVRRQRRRSGSELDDDRPSPLLVRALVNLLVLGLLVGVGFLTKFLLDRQQEEGVALVTFSLVITVLVYILPYMFSGLGRLEMYTQPRYQVYMTLVRTILLELVVLGVTVGFWLIRQRNEASECWETELGQVLYQLVLMEFLFTLGFCLIGEFARDRLYRAGLRWLRRPQFDLANSAMYLVYSQTLVWLGLYFSPLLAAVATLKLFVIFYVKMWSALHSCQPSPHTWRAAQTRTVFHLVAFVSFIGALAAVGFVIFRVDSSSGCGPLQHVAAPWQLVQQLVGSWHSQLLHYLGYVTAPGVVVYIVLLLMILVYFLRNISLTQARRAAALRGQLLMEAQDKKLLLRMIDQRARQLRPAGDGRDEVDSEPRPAAPRTIENGVR